MLDMVVPRSRMRDTIAVLMRHLMPRKEPDLQLPGPSSGDAILQPPRDSTPAAMSFSKG